ncbi:SdpI family protein [Chloroflexus sp.]|uniref:SdpI family protein n=1 Tax=Chloroflexus sp. TaxID=1904827 RepID=UPI002ACE676A|nr:SdpI family protein [Chloroflexus sp.]
MRNLRLMIVITALMWVFGVVMLPFIPDPAPIHWNAAGEVDGYGSPWFVAFFPPAIATVMAALAPLLPRIDPRGQGYAAFSGTYALIMNSVILFFAAMHLITVGVAVGWPISVPRLISFGAALLIAVLGNELGRVTPNYFVGIRTPWTLADPEVWRITHRVGARLFVGGGLASALVSLFVPEHWLFVTSFPLIVIPALVTIPYSYVVWRRLHRTG